MGKSVKYRYIEFFVFDYDSLPFYFHSGITVPLVALDKILQSFICNSVVIVLNLILLLLSALNSSI